MELKVESLEGNVRCVKLTGRLDLKGAQEIETHFTSQVGGSKQSVVVDMSGVEFIASIGIRLLMSNIKALRVANAKIVFLQPRKLVEEILRLAGLDTLDNVAIVQEPAAAVQAVA
jgi:anti-anti-sigma factor